MTEIDITGLTIDGDAIAARITAFDPDTVFYNFGDDGFPSGMVLVKPARLGIHPQVGGTLVTLGGYDGHVDLGDWAVTGSVVVSGPDMQPGPPPYGGPYPINQVRKDDPATADYLSDLVTAIAVHYADHYTGTGLR